MRTAIALAALALALAITPAPAAPAPAAAEVPRALIARAGGVLREFLEDPYATIPPEFLQNARGVAVLPRLRKFSFGLTILRGEGILIARGREEWGAAYPVELEGESLGLELTFQAADTLILIIRNEAMMQRLAEGEEGALILGAEARVDVGPLGLRGGISSAEGFFQITDADIFSYYRSAGLVVGISLPTRARLQRTGGPLPEAEVAELKTHLDRYILRALMMK